MDVIRQLTEQIRSHAKGLDEAGRTKMIDSLRELSHSLETPQDSVNRIMYQSQQIAIIQVAIDLKIFEMMAESDEPLTVATMAQRTGAAPTLLSRFLRYLSSVGVIVETAKDTFTVNGISRLFTTDGWKGGIHLFFQNMGPMYQVLPEFLAERNYQDVQNPTDCPFTKAYSTDLPWFVWAPQNPKDFVPFCNFMTVQREGMPTWLDVYPYRERAKDLSPEQPLFVDVGGGMGHQAIALREALPDVPNKVILEDIAGALSSAIKHPGVEPVEQDFFTPQKVKGARMYYMRNIIHDHPDDRCVTLLTHIKDVLGPDGVILIDEMVMPNEGSHWHAMSLDMTMLCGLSARERTRDEWEQLMAKAGLKIQKIYTYTHSLNDSIIECVPA